MSDESQEPLTMLALGIRGDKPTDPEQPPLVDGIHLRWAPDQELGFPWHGFYLFRRESRPSHTRCLSAELGRIRPGTSQSVRLATKLGRLSSPKPLVFSDDFAPAGKVEADLAASLRFDLPEGVEASRVDVRIGLRAGEVTRTCVDFRRFPLGSAPTPRTEQGAVFTFEPLLVRPLIATTSIDQWSGGPPGLKGTARFEMTLRLEVRLPCPATRVDLLLTNPTAIRVEGFDAAGGSVESALAWMAFEPDTLRVWAALVFDQRTNMRPPKTSVDGACRNCQWSFLKSQGQPWLARSSRRLPPSHFPKRARRSASRTTGRNAGGNRPPHARQPITLTG